MVTADIPWRTERSVVGIASLRADARDVCPQPRDARAATEVSCPRPATPTLLRHGQPRARAAGGRISWLNAYPRPGGRRGLKPPLTAEERSHVL
jgi:hypothetical protein